MTAVSNHAGSPTWGAKRARHKLRVTTVVFFIVIAIPIAILVSFSMKKLHEQAFLQERFAAEQTADAIQKKVVAVVDAEEARPFGDYGFYTAANDAFSNEYLRRSPLSELQSPSAFPGLVGYFQIAPDGSLTSPILPADWSPDQPGTVFPAAEEPARVALLQKIEEILASASNTTTVSSSQKKAATQAAPTLEERDQKALQKGTISKLNAAKISQDSLLNSGTYDKDALSDLRMSKGVLPNGFGMREEAANSPLGNETKQKLARKEAANTIDLQQAAQLDTVAQAQRQKIDHGNAFASVNRQNANSAVSPKITTFEAEIDPFQVLSLEPGYLVFFRKAWHGEKRIIQGAIVESRAFLESLTKDELTASSLPPASSLEVKFQGVPLLKLALPGYSTSEYLSSFSARQSYLKKAPISAERTRGPAGNTMQIFDTALPEPLGRFRVSFAVPELNTPPGSLLVISLGVILATVLVLGTALLYRLGSSQISLAQKRNDFVSAVSHELKTPLTSIRMYGEMLKNDWVPDETKRRSYYEYIFQESERLSRLIGNVLRLSKLSNSNDHLDLLESTPEQLLTPIRQKVEQISKSAGFTLTSKLDSGADDETQKIKVDEDGLSQIAINLVDNAVKFSKDCERKEIELGFRVEESTGKIIFYVRDFGPGVAKAEQRKIFGLFYRSENELTRKTSGTGIGLALVKELAAGMGARIDYRGRDPGAEFQVIFDRL